MEGLMYPIPFASAADVLEIVTSAEQFGYDSVWANDHITTQEYVRKSFPSPPNYYDALVTLSFAAQATKKVFLAAGLIPLPLREPVQLAKQVATLDVFSGGRMILGVGLGAYLEEFEALHPTMKGVVRAELLDEELRALVKLFKEPTASFDGKYVKFADIQLYPKPLQDPLPIYIGGNSTKAIERTVQLGQGWFPAGFTPAEMAERIAILHRLCKANGRDPTKIDVAPQLSICTGRTDEEAVKKYKKSQLYKHDISLLESTLKGMDMERFYERDLIGSEDRVIKRAEEYVDAGLTHFAGLIFVANTAAHMVNEMRIFAERIMPSFK